GSVFVLRAAVDLDRVGDRFEAAGVEQVHVDLPPRVGVVRELTDVDVLAVEPVGDAAGVRVAIEARRGGIEAIPAPAHRVLRVDDGPVVSREDEVDVGAVVEDERDDELGRIVRRIARVAVVEDRVQDAEGSILMSTGVAVLVERDDAERLDPRRDLAEVQAALEDALARRRGIEALDRHHPVARAVSDQEEGDGVGVFGHVAFDADALPARRDRAERERDGGHARPFADDALGRLAGVEGRALDAERLVDAGDLEIAAAEREHREKSPDHRNVRTHQNSPWSRTVRRLLRRSVGSPIASRPRWSTTTSYWTSRRPRPGNRRPATGEKVWMLAEAGTARPRRVSSWSALGS